MMDISYIGRGCVIPHQAGQSSKTMINRIRLHNQALNRATQSLKGTFIYAAICAEGIVLVADSRANFQDNNKKVFFIDHLQKIFKHGNYLIAFAGTKNSFGSFIESHLDKMDDINVSSPVEWLTNFALLLQKFYSEEQYNKIMETLVTIATGYSDEGVPFLCAIKGGKVHYCNSGMLCNQDYLREKEIFEHLNFNDTVEVLKEDIEKFVVDNDKSTDIGGDFTVATINVEKGPVYLENPNLLCWTSFAEMKQFASCNNNLLTPIAPFSEIDILAVLAKT